MSYYCGKCFKKAVLVVKPRTGDSSWGCEDHLWPGWMTLPMWLDSGLGARPLSTTPGAASRGSQEQLLEPIRKLHLC